MEYVACGHPSLCHVWYHKPQRYQTLLPRKPQISVADSYSAIQKITPVYATLRFITVFTKYWHIFSQLSTVHSFTLSSSVHFNLLKPETYFMYQQL